MNLLQEIFGIVPTVPGSWTIPGPAGNAAMMGSVLEQRNGGMMLVDPHTSGEALLALRAEAAARGAELVVIDHGSPRWEEEFVARFEQATTTGRVQRFQKRFWNLCGTGFARIKWRETLR
eukprot:COSAG06_NODE_2096_length_7603_cov_8.520656_8_plen_120_part_00